MLEITQALTAIFMFAVLIQFCVDRIKEVLGSKVLTYIKPPVWALGFGILFALIFQLDIFALLGFVCAYPLAAQIVTGLVMSAGSTPIYELIQKLRQSRLYDEKALSIGEAATYLYNTSLEQRTESTIYEKTVPPSDSDDKGTVTGYGT